AQGCQAAADATGHAGIAHIGVHRVGKIHGSGAGRQLHDLAFGGKYVNLVREQVNFDVLDKFEGVAGILLHFQQSVDPLARTDMGVAGSVIGGFVQPMGGDAVVGHGLHFLGADLDLNGHTVHAKQSGMQGLVAVGLGNRDIVLKTAGNWLVKVVNSAQHAITGIYRVHHDTEGIHIHDFGEGFTLGAHLLVDAVQVFFAAEYTRLHEIGRASCRERV